MSFDAKKLPKTQEIGTQIPGGTPVGSRKKEIKGNIQSILGIFRLDFSIENDIHHEGIKQLLSSGKYSLNNFEESGYGSIQTKNPDMGTGYALVSGQYFDMRGIKQGIHIFEQSEIVGKTSYINTQGIKIETSIYFVGPIPDEKKSEPATGIKKPISGAYDEEDIKKACEELLKKSK